ncbi:MAG: efflux RND transporter periplasmic adaptor subunit [Armatimonadota bacterium]
MSNAERPWQRSRGWLWWVGALIALVAGIAFAATRPPQVGVATAQLGDLSVQVTATGQAEGRVAEVAPSIQGQIQTVYRDEGDWVSRGDLLARIIAPSAGLTTSSAWESLEAPFDGVVSRRYIDPGDPALPGQPAFQVADTTEVWVTALIDDIDVAKVHEGQPVRIALPSYLGRFIPGRIAQIAATATPRTEMGTGGRVVRTRIELPEGRGPLRPGMEVDVTAEAVVARGVLLIPADAVMEDESGRWVYRVEDGRIRRTPVEVGANNYVQSQIISGLSAGDVVVVNGKETVGDGDRVRTTERTSG